MIRKCDPRPSGQDFGQIVEIINDAAEVYRKIIPDEYYSIPYMTPEILKSEIERGITFWGLEEEGKLVGVMGFQPLKDVTLIRHAYVRTSMQQKGVGSQLLTYLYRLTRKPVLIGTWAQAFWAIRFYQKHGFNLVPKQNTPALLDKYWTVPKWHKEKSVVLADAKWFQHGSPW